jgi:hypothetical protein
MARRFSVTVDCADPASLAAFWVEALGYAIDDAPPLDAPADERNGWASLADPDGAGPGVFLQRVPEGKVAKNRMHLDLDVGGEGSYGERKARIDAERARLRALGASDDRGAHDVEPSYWVRMNDPEGNEFCLV